LGTLSNARLARRQTHQIAVHLIDDMADPGGLAHPALLAHVAHFAMNGDEDFGTQPAIELFQFRATGVARDVDVALAVGDDLDALRGQLVLDAADGDFIAGDLTAGEEHDIARLQLDRMVAVRDAGQRRARLPCPPVATISTSPRGRSIARSTSIRSGSLSR
jgi:hypothetical protein